MNPAGCLDFFRADGLPDCCIWSPWYQAESIFLKLHDSSRLFLRLCVVRTEVFQNNSALKDSLKIGT